MSATIRMQSRLASAEHNLSPGEECPVGKGGMSPETAKQLLNAGYAELVRGTVVETATEPRPDESGVDIRVEQSGSWYTIYKDGEQVDKVQGEEARDAVLADLEG